MGKKEYKIEKSKDYREKGIRYVKTWQKAKDNRNNQPVRGITEELLKREF